MEDDVRFNMGMDLPVNLQKLSLIDTHCKLDSLVYLNNLTHLELRDISDLEISNTRPFDCFKKLYDHCSHFICSIALLYRFFLNFFFNLFCLYWGAHTFDATLIKIEFSF